jgi:hypothetical protein
MSQTDNNNRSLFTRLYDVANASLDKRLNDLTKSEVLEKKEKADGFGRRGLLWDPFVENANASGLFKPKGGFITNALLKQVSRRAPAASIVIHTRSSQVQAFCREQPNRFDTGYTFLSVDKGAPIDPEEIKRLKSFVNNCGVKEGRAHDDQLTFDQWGYMVTSDMLKYGHCAIERGTARVNDQGQIAYFLPLAAENIYYANDKSDQKAIHAQRNQWRAASEDENRLDQEPGPPVDKIEYVQVLDNKVVEEFTRHEMIFAKINNETDIDLQGYCVGPLERALSMVSAQLQVENHQRGFFTNGVASRGILVIQGDMTPNQLRALQAQWTQQVTGPLNSWRTPILAGIKGVQWVSLTAGNRDMEYAAYQDHVLRTIHACFAIDPEETGFGYLSKGTEQRSMGESSNEYKILASQSKGLRPILCRIESIMNEEVLPFFDPKLAQKYKFAFAGLDAETREEETSRLAAAVALHTSVNEARKEADLKPIPFGGDLILNPILLQTLQANMFKGMFMEVFMGVEGASERPDLQYVADPLWFQWQQLQMQVLSQQAAGAAGEGEDGQEGQESDEEGEPSGDSGKSDKKKKKKGPPKKDGEEGDEDDDQDAAMAAMQQQQVMSQALGAQAFIESNPELFKSMKNTIYWQRLENLRKGDVGRPDDSHVDKLAAKLMKDYESGAKLMMNEVMQAVRDETCDHKDE